MAESDLREEVVGGSPEVLREQALRQVKKRRDCWDVFFPRPITEEEVRQEMDRLAHRS